MSSLSSNEIVVGDLFRAFSFGVVGGGSIVSVLPNPWVDLTVDGSLLMTSTVGFTVDSNITCAIRYPDLVFVVRFRSYRVLQ